MATTLVRRDVGPASIAGPAPIAALRRTPAVVLCALVAHAAVYHSLWPADGMHRYFAWYAPLVAVLSAVSIVGLPLVLAAALMGRRDGAAARLIRGVASGGRTSSDSVTETVRLASAAVAFLAAQESLEHSLALHRVAPARFSPLIWVVLLTVVLAVAGALIWVSRAVAALVAVLLQRRSTSVSRPGHSFRLSGLVGAGRRSRPLAVHGGLRAPPLGS